MAAKKTKRPTPVSVLMSKDELQLADAIAEKFTCSRAAVLRMGLAELAKKESE